MVYFSKLALFSLFVPAILGYEDTCSPFTEIYEDGTQLCEVMWGGAFEVVDDEEQGYTMWFFDHDNNPNDATTRTLFGDDKVVDTCHLDYFHKDVPSPEGDGMTECHPWKNNACCSKDTVPDVDTLNENYGSGYEWNRCGAMSQSCERFFVAEACLYECEPAAGLYRKFNNSQVGEEGYNAWQIEKMPIKKSFCNAWYDACRSDYFCGKGDYFECKEYYVNKTKTEELERQEELLEFGDLKKEKSQVDKNNDGLVIGLSVAGACVGIGLVLGFLLIVKEKQGTPLFAPVGEKEIA